MNYFLIISNAIFEETQTLINGIL